MAEKKSKIVFYCKTCEKIIENPKKMVRKYVYICPHCKTKNVAFGTEKSIMNFYHIEEPSEDELSTEKKGKMKKKKVEKKVKEEKKEEKKRN